MIRTTILTLIVCFAVAQAPAIAASARVKIARPPENAGRISRFLFGSFIELLDDLVPGMRAEMLNDRGFDGVLPSSNWCYYNGLPNICDREWDTNSSWSLDSSEPFNGARSAKLLPRKGRPASLTQSGLATKKGMTYLFSGHFRSQGPNVQARVVLKTQLPDGKWLELGSARLPMVTPKAADHAALQTHKAADHAALQTHKAAGHAALQTHKAADHAALQTTKAADYAALQTPKAADYAALQTPKAADHAALQMSQWSRLQCKMISSGATDRAVFELRATGTDALWADKLCLMPADNLKGWRKDVVQAIKEAHPGVIRWGGSVCDPGGYRWKDGIGDPDSRTPFANKVWGRIDSNDVGIDEFVQFCELVDAEPLVCLSFSDGAKSAGDLVRYCKGRVKYWQIGNELGDQAYVDGCGEFCKAIKEADPRAIILASYPSKALLEKVGSSLDYVCPHHYTPDLGACEASLSDITQMLSSTPGCGEIKIGVTEWNISGGSWGLQRSSLFTLDAALANARYLNLLLRRSDIVQIACRSNMTNSMCSGMIQTNPAGLYKTPSYYAMKLYADHAKQIYAPVEGSPKDVDIAASVSEDGKSLCVFAVNGKAEPVELSIDLSEYPGLKLAGAETLRDTLDTRQPEVVNGWARPDRNRTVELKVGSDVITLPALSASAIELKAR